MEWVKLSTRYHNDPAVIRAGETAEVLFTRALAFCGEQETDGFVPAEMIARLTPARGRARAAALVREGLWEVVQGGFAFVSWEKHQVSVDALEAARAANRKRQSGHRERGKARRNAVTNASPNASVTPTEVEVEVDAAAAALRDALPETLAILRSKLEARKLIVRWDKLADDQCRQICDLVELHGDGPLVNAALKTYRPDNPPVFAQAWLATWSSIPVPGKSLQAVPDEPCPKDGHQGTVRRCTACITEAREA